jgi:hypothetical protein
MEIQRQIGVENERPSVTPNQCALHQSEAGSPELFKDVEGLLERMITQDEAIP